MDLKIQKILAEIKADNLANNVPSITIENAKFIHFLLRLKKAKNVLEIGTCQGYSGIWISQAIREFNGKLVTYEISTPSIVKAHKNFKKAEVEKYIDFRTVNFLECPPDKTEKFDVIFIDAQKNLYHKFWQQIQQNLKNDSLIIVDDVLKFRKKTDKFHKLITNNQNFEQVI